MAEAIAHRRGAAPAAGQAHESSRTGASSVACGSSHSPVWTADGWMIVLDGAASQWKRSDCSMRGDRARGRVARRRRAASASRWRSTSSGVGVGVQRGEPRAVEPDPRRQEAVAAAEQDDAGVDALAALDARDDLQHRVLEGLTRHGAPPRPRRANARGVGQPRAAGSRRRTRALAAAQPRLGDRGRRRRHDRRVVEPRREPLVRLERSSPRAAAARGRGSAGTRGPPRRRGPRRRAGGTARRRGRSATPGRASTAGSGCAACGRRS